MAKVLVLSTDINVHDLVYTLNGHAASHTWDLTAARSTYPGLRPFDYVIVDSAFLLENPRKGQVKFIDQVRSQDPQTDIIAILAKGISSENASKLGARRSISDQNPELLEEILKTI